MNHQILSDIPNEDKGRYLRSIGGFRRRFSLIACCAGALLCAQGAGAETLIDALGRAYLGNPALQAERAKLRSVDEQVPQALAGMRPSISATATALKERVVDHTAQAAYGLNTRTAGIEITQPLYRGGRIQSGISGAQNRMLAQRAALLSAEQSTLLSAATAYMDVARDQLNLELINNYQKVLKNRYEIEKRRLVIGENTKTDVSQAEARLAQAMSDRLQAEASLRASSSDYVRITGVEPGTLANPEITLDLPGALDDVMEAARLNNPDVVSAQYAELSSRNDVEAVDGELLPTVDAVGNVSRSWNTSTTQNVLDSASLQLRVTVPIDNGSVSARARGARQTANQMMLQVENAQRTAVDKAVKSWNYLMATRAQIRAREAMIRSINETLKSLRTEVNIGSRTVTDLLNSEQEALSGRLELLAAKHDEVVWALTLLAATGRLSAQSLKLPVGYYDYEAHYQRVRGKIWGVSLVGDSK